MYTEKEGIEEELSALMEHHKEFLTFKLGIEYVEQGERFEKFFQTLDSIVCTDCGREFRITHLCDVINERKWRKNWKGLLLEL